MKVYLDDTRIPTNDWILTKDVASTIKLLETGKVTHLSLDHDLGDIPETGYDVLLWIEKKVFLNNFNPPKIIVHSSNPSGKQKMLLAIQAINKIYANTTN